MMRSGIPTDRRGRSADPRSDALTIAIAAAIVTSALMLMTGLAVKERSEYQGRGGEHPIRAIGDVLQVCVLCGVSAVGAASLEVNLSSLEADVIDYDELHSGERKEGAYFAVWHLASKSATGISAALVGFLLAASGFEPNVEQSRSSLVAIRAMESGIPAAGFLGAMLVLLRFRLTREAHAQVRAQLDARATSRA
jgi:Na+/melibiose symporter-like transporter